MKVLVLTTTFPRWVGDATPAFVYELSTRLKQKGYEMVVLAPHHGGSAKFEIWDGMKIYRYPYFWPYKYQKLAYDGGIISNLEKSWLARVQLPIFLIAGLISSIRIVRRENINLIHSHWIVPCGVYGAVCRLLYNVKHVTTAHAGDVFTIKDSALKFFVSIAMRRAERITANSQYTWTILTSIDAHISKKTLIIPMGVDTARFKPNNFIDLKKEHDAEFIILSIGRLVKKKGIDNLIKAMALITEIFPSAVLLIGGSGPERQYLEELVRELKLENNVRFLGFIPSTDLSKFFPSADIFVLPSIETKKGDTEGLGVVLLEAMACKTAVIGSNIGGITDIIIDGVNGSLSNPGDPEDLAEKIIKLLRDEDLREQFSTEGKRTVDENFSWDVVIEKFSRLYEKLYEKHIQ